MNRHIEHFLDKGRVALVLRFDTTACGLMLNLNSWLVGLSLDRDYSVFTIHLLFISLSLAWNLEED